MENRCDTPRDDGYYCLGARNHWCGNAPICFLSLIGDVTIEGLPPAPVALLTALASIPEGRATRRRLGALAGYSSRKSTLRNALSTLRTRSLIETPGDDVIITPAGRKLAGPPPAPKTTDEVIGMWRSRLPATPLALFDALIDAYPKRLSRTELGERAGVDPTKSTLRNAISYIRVRGLVSESGDELGAANELFPTGPLR